MGKAKPQGASKQSHSHICHDRVVDQRPPPFGVAHAVAQVGKWWTTGTELSLAFMDGNSEQWDFVEKHMREWESHANIRFTVVDDPNQATLRCSFAYGGAWSYVGKDNLTVGKANPTMNFGWLDPGTVYHEFGHAIGLSHGHQNKQGDPLIFDREKVIQVFSGPPNNWSLSQIEHNVLNFFSADHVVATDFDPASIMTYWFDPAIIASGQYPTKPNEHLSNTDKDFIDTLYPGAPKTQQGLVIPNGRMMLAVDGAIGAYGEEDVYEMEIDEPGMFSATTTGSTDLVMTLYGPDDKSRLVAQDDDSGIAHNPRLAGRIRAPGRYWLSIRHYSQSGTGQYVLHIARLREP